MDLDAKAAAPLASPRPHKDQLANLDPRTAMVRVKCGRTEIDNGRWQAVGRLQDWNPADWPTPAHTRAVRPASDWYGVLSIRATVSPGWSGLAWTARGDLAKTSGMGALALEREPDRQL